MHILQSKHAKLKLDEAKKLLENLNISLAQLPKIKKEDAALPPNCEIGDIIKIERKIDGKISVYYRAVV